MVPSVTLQLFLSVKEQQRKKWHNHCVMPTTAVAFLPLYTFAPEITTRGSAGLPVCCIVPFFIATMLYLLSISCTSLVSSSSSFTYNPTRIANPDSLNSDPDKGFFAESGSRSKFKSSVQLKNV
jgi:hypothetical protein